MTRSKSRFRVLAALIFVALIVAFFALGWNRYFTLVALTQRRAELDGFYRDNPVIFIGGFIAIYLTATALSLPGAAVLTLAAGALFGFGIGTAVASVSSTAGATLAFLLARFILREPILRRYGDRLATIDAGIKRDGSVYLLSIRLIPAVPFFLVNILMALTAIRTLTFVLVSAIGMLPGTMVYIYAGTQLAILHSMSDILSPRLLLAFVLLGIFPLFARWGYGIAQRRRTYARYNRPRRFDYNMVVVGAGSAGLVSALIAATVKAKVALIEKDKMGGDCLNTGCVPSKALIRSTRLLSYAHRASEFGFKSLSIDFDFAQVMERVQRVVRAIEPHDSPDRYTALGVECIAGEARIRDPYRVEVNGRVLTTRTIVVATGAEPIVPPIPGIADVPTVTSETIWSLRALPPRLLVLGGGPIGCELAQCFARLGSKVTIVDMAPRLLTKEDPEIAEMVADRFRREGITLVLGRKAAAFDKRLEGSVLVAESALGDTVEIPFDLTLLALGRRARVKGFGLEELGVRIADQGTIEADPYLRTNIPNIHVCGDVAGPYQFTHVASQQAWYASVNALFGRFYKVRADYRIVPWTTFTDPEVARVGLSEDEARARNIAVEITRYDIADLDRAITDEEAHGIVKILTPPGRDTILGVTIVGQDAGDLIAELVLAMKQRIGLKKIFGTIHIYPTLAEANKYAAGSWQRQHVSPRMLAMAERFQTWQRG
ncbi:MAG: mercuric reductase [Rhodospirillales bacterium]|nr:mercuric reductase [Rhodospirillales bacterium]